MPASPSEDRHGGHRDRFGGHSIARLCEEHGTPLYVYDEAALFQRVDELSAFDVIRYAQKANSNLGLLDLFRRRGIVVDAVSTGEIMRALHVGYQPIGTPPPIVYTADVFCPGALDLIAKHGIRCNLGSTVMLEQLASRIGGCPITLRINPGFGHGHSRKTNTGGPHSKHGIWFAQLDQVTNLASRLGLTISGLHMHIGSGTDEEHLSKVCSALLAAAQQIGASIDTISTGGGLPVPYQPGEARVDVDAYFHRWNQVRQQLEKSFGHNVTLETEPGRYLVAEAGILVTEILGTKRVGDRMFYLVDAGFNTLARPAMYGAFHRISVCHRNGAGAGEMQDVVVGGPLCESGDVFTQSADGIVTTQRLPKASEGDWLIIEDAGAYGAAMSSNYNSHPLAAEVLVGHDRVDLVRQRQETGDLWKWERIPRRELADDGL